MATNQGASRLLPKIIVSLCLLNTEYVRKLKIQIPQEYSRSLIYLLNIN